MGVGKWIGLGFGIGALGAALAFAQYRNIETPDYEVLISEGDFELRDYGPMIVAEVTHSGSRRETQGRSFRRLAAYIFGEDRPEGGESIAMTSPVITERVDQDQSIAMTAPVISEPAGDNRWRMRFVMPSRYTLETLPTPPSDISLTRVAARRMAAIRFSGNASNDELDTRREQLRSWIDSEGLTSIGDFQYAFYDAPMVPGPLRRNEVLIEVAAEE